MLLTSAARNHQVAKEGAGLSSSALREYARIKTGFIAFVSEAVERAPTLADLTLEHARGWQVMKRRGGISNATLEHYTTRLRAWAGWLADELPEVFEEGNPLARLDSPRPEQKLPTTLSQQQIRTLLLYCGETRNPRRNMAIILLFWDSGIRNDELCHLRLEDVEYATRSGNGRARIRLGKGKKERFVGFGDRTSRAIKAYADEERPKRPGSSSDWLFPNTSGGPIHPNSVREVFRVVRAKANIKVRAHPHAVRHTYGKEQAARGTNAFAIQAQMGHARIDQTQQYVRLAETDIARSYRSLVDEEPKRGTR